MISVLAAILMSLQTFPPKLPDGKDVVTDTSEAFLKPGSTLKSGVEIAKTAPAIDFMYFPGQDYAGKPWSNWGDSIAAGGKYYASIGDHLSPAGDGFVVMSRLRNLPALHATPIVVLTGREAGHTREKALKAGTAAFFQKPVEPGLLLDAIRRAIAGDVETVSLRPDVRSAV